MRIQSDRFDFGFSSTPGANALQLRTELKAEAKDDETFGLLTRSRPDLVIITAPSNNLTTSPSVVIAAEDFRKYLLSVLHFWQEVAILDFPPRGDVSQELQHLLRQEYRRVAASLGKIISVV